MKWGGVRVGWSKGNFITNPVFIVATVYYSIIGQVSYLSVILYTKIDQILVNSLHGPLNCEIGGSHCRVITTEYRTHVHCIHM